MNRFATLVGLAVRELWITFRLLAILAALLLAGLAAVVIPPLFDVSPQAAYAVALTVDTVFVASVAAFTLAAERRMGSVAWLAVRAMPRTLLLHAWLTAFAVVAVLGLLGSAAVAWLAIVEQPGPAPVSFGPALIAAGAALLAALSLGLLAGALLPPLPAATIAAFAAAIVVVPPFVAGPGLPLPGGGLALLAESGGVARPIGSALQSAGVALALASISLALSALALQRADL